MSEDCTLTPVAHIRTDFPTKFGIPRQSGLIKELKGDIVFEPPYRTMDAVRGLDAFSHIWLIWGFSQSRREGWSPVVRPPKLGGNEKVGVFASRSPYRPNPVGLSLVQLERVLDTPQGPILRVLGADLVDGTPIYDIKPYLPYVECIPDARGGFSEAHKADRLPVHCPDALLNALPEDRRAALLDVLALDPRPAYQADEQRVYGLYFMDLNVRFTVRSGVLTVLEMTPRQP